MPSAKSAAGMEYVLTTVSGMPREAAVWAA